MNNYTVGVEQEFLLVDPDSRRPVALAPRVREISRAPGDLDVQGELTPFQIEVATGVTSSFAELDEQVRRGRRVLVDAADEAGCRLVATGMPPIGEAGPPPGSDDPRYHQIEYSHRRLVVGKGACGLHVHVGVPDRAEALRASNKIRVWLPTLLALSANSPYYEGEDTGYASWRSMVWSRWPVSGPPPEWDGPEQYDGTVDALIATQALLDKAMVYWDVRPSEDHPTVEVRVADIPQLATEVAVLAELIGALVVTEPSEGRVDDSVLRAAYWRASRDGVDGLAADPHTGKLSPAFDRAVSLVEHVEVALRDRGTLSTVEQQLDWLRHNGSGAARQRRSPDPESLVDMLIARTREET
ncbi:MULTISPECIES: carboxylate-amine ligase [Lentzea]|uniref:Putative glutamate--cysteine ligase 2 n=1 Tax=Lentzea albida TaxID=65499 RepID=A0A1H9HG05_9PSEU|nr:MULTISPECIES: glutamate--cysteine ligase [Lentzea]USX52056.1 glutamate--cysteine ligase [Lentzea sp. HUAS12]SEQ61247.1 carboxylate-amine ligase [Lentzea albida]